MATHNGLVEELGSIFLGDVVVNFIVFAVTKNLDLATSHLFIPLHYILLTSCSCFLDKCFAGGHGGMMINLTILGDEVNGMVVSVVSNAVFNTFLPAH